MIFDARKHVRDENQENSKKSKGKDSSINVCIRTSEYKNLSIAHSDVFVKYLIFINYPKGWKEVKGRIEFIFDSKRFDDGEIGSNEWTNYRLFLLPLFSKRKFGQTATIRCSFLTYFRSYSFATNLFYPTWLCYPTHPLLPSSPTTVISRRNITLSRARIPTYQIFCTLLFQRWIRTLWINNWSGENRCAKWYCHVW